MKTITLVTKKKKSKEKKVSTSVTKEEKMKEKNKKSTYWRLEGEF